MVKANKVSNVAGEAKSVSNPINETKMLELIHKMVPSSKEKSPTLKDGVLFLLDELNRTQIALKEAQKAIPVGGAVGGSAEILAGIGRLEASLKNVKEQFSTMRQYGVGTKA